LWFSFVAKGVACGLEIRYNRGVRANGSYGFLMQVSPVGDRMSNLNYFIGSGKVARKSFKTVNTKNGEAQVCQLTVPIQKWKPGSGGAEGTNETLWFDVTAWGRPTDKFNQAENWNKKFDKGHFVTIQGELDVRTFDTKEGEHRVSFILDNAKVDFSAGAPREAPEPTESNPFFS
jgi:single-stranded DNA-binding protein